MQLLIYFFRKYRFFLFFLLLEIIAFSLIVRNLTFHRSKFFNSANALAGSFYKKSTTVNDFLNLRNENDLLIEENLFLKSKLSNFSSKESPSSMSVTDSVYETQYTYKSGIIINNKFINDFNYITINLGEKDSVFSEMAVCNHKGIIGITDVVSNKYARVISILNKNSRINAKPKNNNHFGTLKWDGKDYKTVQLEDIPRQANLKVGDTIITGGMSAIFPEGLPIGEIKSIHTGATSLEIEVSLFNDMSNIRNIYVISNFDKSEIRELEIIENE